MSELHCLKIALLHKQTPMQAPIFSSEVLAQYNSHSNHLWGADQTSLSDTKDMKQRLMAHIHLESISETYGDCG